MVTSSWPINVSCAMWAGMKFTNPGAPILADFCSWARHGGKQIMRKGGVRVGKYENTKNPMQTAWNDCGFLLLIILTTSYSSFVVPGKVPRRRRRRRGSRIEIISAPWKREVRATLPPAARHLNGRDERNCHFFLVGKRNGRRNELFPSLAAPNGDLWHDRLIEEEERNIVHPPAPARHWGSEIAWFEKSFPKESECRVI